MRRPSSMTTRCRPDRMYFTWYFWQLSVPMVRQVFVATAVAGPADEIRIVGATNPGLVPAWVDVRSWRGFPIQQRRPR